MVKFRTRSHTVEATQASDGSWWIEDSMGGYSARDDTFRKVFEPDVDCATEALEALATLHDAAERMHTNFSASDCDAVADTRIALIASGNVLRKLRR